MNPIKPIVFELSDKMSSAWIEFIKTGNPNTKGLPEWDAYNAATHPTMIFDKKSYLKKTIETPICKIISTNQLSFTKI